GVGFINGAGRLLGRVSLRTLLTERLYRGVGANDRLIEPLVPGVSGDAPYADSAIFCCVFSFSRLIYVFRVRWKYVSDPGISFFNHRLVKVLIIDPSIT